MKNIFTAHPHALNETYWQHCWFACCFGAKMFFGGIACFIHAIFPFFFEKTGSNFLIKMMHDFVERMPQCESRLLPLVECLEKKKQQ